MTLYGNTLLVTITMLLQMVIFVGVAVVAFGVKQHLSRILQRKPFVWLTNDGRHWAVVTGASRGIGFEFARQLAFKGYNLLLLSLSEEELNKAKKKILQELKENNPINCIRIQTLATDFSQLDIYERVEKFLAPFKNDIFVLVNNVGMLNPIPDYFLGNDHTTLNRKIINVNIVCITRMLELVLPSMVCNSEGLVISLSSFTSGNIVPFFAIYGATKAYISHLMRNLAAEYSPKGIVFATFSPTIVSTQMAHNVSPSLIVPSSRDYVQSALNEIKYGQSFQSSGYLVHYIMENLLSLFTFIFTHEFLSRMLILCLTQVQKSLLKIKQMKHKPKLDLALIFDRNHEIWKTD